MITPRAEDCFGRDALIEEMILAANEHRSVLLFGGRQSGKTSILVRTRFLLGKKIQDEKAHLRTSVTVPVYLDLMKLPYDAGPADLFFQMFDAANSACSQLLGSRYLWRIPWPTFCKTMSFEQLVARIDGLLRKRKGLDIRLIFLFDEAKRVLGDRFPRGFQDNLFAFL